ncbi:hypothetical protein V6L77_14450 [Pannonibacter sp. Pt2-lr]
MPVLCIYPVTGPAGRQIQTVLLFPGAALAEITGCFAVWDRWGLGKSDWWLLPGAFALALLPSCRRGRTVRTRAVPLQPIPGYML